MREAQASPPQAADPAELARMRAVLVGVAGDIHYAKMSERVAAVFVAVARHPTPPSVRHVAEQLNIPKSAVVRALDTLEDLHLVSRKRPAADRRSVRITLTAAGKALADGAAAAAASQGS